MPLEGKTHHHVALGVDALRPRHAGIGAGGADTAADLRAEEPVQRGDEQGGDEQQQGHGIFQTQLPHKALGYDQVVLVHADGLIGLAAHDPQVYGIERQLRQNTGQNSGDAAAGMERSGDKACRRAAQGGDEQRQPRICAAANQHDAGRAAQRQRAVHGQVGHVQNAVGDVYADGHQSPDEALGNGARQRVEKRGEQHVIFLPFPCQALAQKGDGVRSPAAEPIRMRGEGDSPLPGYSSGVQPSMAV